MNDKQKYEQVLKRAKDLLDDMDKGDYFASKADIENIFPELKESEDKDERIRKEIIDFVKSRGGFKGDWLAWLEKQGKNKSVDKPKFKVGDWITDGHLICKVLSVTGKSYELHLYNDDYCHFETDIQSVDKRYHLWSINDAKDGDVLVTTAIRNCPFIYRKTDYNNNLAYYYAGIDGSGDFCEGCIKRTLYHFGPLSNVVPATKEQRDILFQKMKEVGYEWDSEKKELKKIKIKSKNLELKTLNADKVVEWLKNNGWCTVGGPKVKMAQINKFKNDFGL